MSADQDIRKLTAILHADVKGYSRLMGDDESLTVRALKECRNLFAENVKNHGGRIVNAPGDSILAEFPSVVSAVQCAVAVQAQLNNRNADLPDSRKMEFRIGVNLGDVIQSEDAIYGDGVNIAARIEALAEPGGVSISRTVYNHVHNKLEYGYQYLGEHHVKNIADPVRVYKLLTAPEDAGKLIGDPELKPASPKGLYVALALAVLIISTITVWQLYLRPSEKEAMSGETVVDPLLDKPSIAVLPFVNLSKDPEQEYFSDGITNDIITALSKFGDLLVIASNTTFTYKGKAVNIESIGSELGVRYVLEGSVQKTGSKVRINAQLIDAITGFHIWSERYNLEIKEIFQVQEEIVQTIVGKLAVKIEAVERQRVLKKKTDSLEAYDYLLRGKEYSLRRTCSDINKSREMFEKAIELDPDFSAAYAGLSTAFALYGTYGCTEFYAQALEHAEGLAQKSLKLDDSNEDAYAQLGYVYTYSKRYDLAINYLNRSIELNPNNAQSLRRLGMVLLWSGNQNEAIQALESAARYDPNSTPGGFMALGGGYYLKGEYNKAINVLEEGVTRWPGWVGNNIILTATYAQADRLADAEREAKEVLRLDPFFEVGNYGTVFQNQKDRDKIVDGLRKAGLK